MSGSSERNSSADLPPHEPMPSVEPEAIVSATRFNDDLESFRRGAGLIMEHVATLADQIPEAWHMTSPPTYPPDWKLLALIASERLGYDMPSIPHPLMLTDLQTYSGEESESDLQEFALLELLKRATNGSIYSFHLKPDLQVTVPSLEYMKELSERFPAFLQRGFMTAVLTRALQGQTYSSTEDRVLYEELAEAGLQPLANEELLGLTQRIIQYASKAFPDDYPAPPQRQPRQGQ